MKILRLLVVFINCIAALALLAAYASPMIDPSRVPFLSFLGLMMPYIIIINVCFVLFWAVKARLYFLISLLTIAIAWGGIKTSFPYHNSSKEDSKNERGLRVMSYNVRVFDRYNWTKDSQNVSRMLNFIKEQDPDIICMQEFGSSKEGLTERFLLNALGKYPYHYISYSEATRAAKHSQGLAILSKYPISNKHTDPQIHLADGYTIHADVRVGKTTYKVINTYFSPIRLINKYDFIGGLDSKNYKDNVSKAINSIHEAAVQHTQHARRIKTIINETEDAVILCSDMNSSPISYTYHQLTTYLDDAFLKYGTGFGATYNGKYPFLRIDYILYSPELTLLSYNREKAKHSDHFPIIAEFKIEE